jgi:hypothetical protein
MNLVKLYLKATRHPMKKGAIVLIVKSENPKYINQVGIITNTCILDSKWFYKVDIINGISSAFFQDQIRRIQ